MEFYADNFQLTDNFFFSRKKNNRDSLRLRVKVNKILLTFLREIEFKLVMKKGLFNYDAYILTLYKMEFN